MRLDVGIGEWQVSNRPEDELKTYALGSCVAVLAYDPKNRVAGLIHVALPDSKVNQDKALKLPGYFADTGLPVLFEEMQKKGAAKKNIKVKLTGGSSIMDQNRHFDIGRRNTIAIKRYLWKNGYGVVKEDTGGNSSRTVSFKVGDGTILVSNAGKSWEI
ncbi:MAG TPA: chemotaxis protein CheD [Sediminispirochaeta sp.]|nr:chemotaxis protein CheD [Sediminispirochaeta sp.]